MFRLFQKTSWDIGVDLGSANTRIWCNHQGLLLDEPSVVALERSTGRLIAVGGEAAQLLGRSPINMQMCRPLRDGVVVDFDAAVLMLQAFVRQVSGGALQPVHRMIVGVPGDTTEVERRAVTETAGQTGVRSVWLVPKSLLSGIGAGLPVEAPVGSMVVDIGAGTVEVAVLCSQGCVATQTVRTAGEAINEGIVSHLRKAYDLMIGNHTAEQIKLELGGVGEVPNAEMEVCGQDVLTGLPRTLLLDAAEVYECMVEPTRLIFNAVRRTLEETPPQLVADIYRRGIVLCGGGALIRGLDEGLARETGICVHIAEAPLECVTRGTGQLLEHPQKWSRVLDAQVVTV